METELVENSSSMTEEQIIEKLGYSVEKLEIAGETIIEITGIATNEIIQLKCQSGTTYKIYARGGWMGAENEERPAEIEDISGDIEDLIGSKLIIAECRKSDAVGKIYRFYHFATMKGRVDIRFTSESSEYYGGDVFLE